MGELESVNRRTDNTMAKRIRTKRQTMISGFQKGKIFLKASKSFKKKKKKTLIFW
jgi:hypothetical protein